jgi:SOS-response transcriptional repressor LexA
MEKMDETPRNPTDGPAWRLKQARVAAGYRTAKEFSDRFKIAQATYSTHESGARGIRLETAQYYAKLLNANTAWLLTGEGYGLEPDEVIPPSGPKPEVEAVDFLGEHPSLREKYREIFRDTMEEPSLEDDYWGVFKVKESAMNVDGILKDDIVIVDFGSEREDSDIVLASINSNASSRVIYIIRRYEPPFLLARSTSPDYRTWIVDDNDVTVVGSVAVVVRSLR